MSRSIEELVSNFDLIFTGLGSAHADKIKAGLVASAQEHGFAAVRSRLLAPSSLKSIEHELCSIVEELYQTVEPPLVAKMAMRSMLAAQSSAASQPSQADWTLKSVEFYTQAAPSLGGSDSEAAEGARDDFREGLEAFGEAAVNQPKRTVDEAVVDQPKGMGSEAVLGQAKSAARDSVLVALPTSTQDRHTAQSSSGPGQTHADQESSLVADKTRAAGEEPIQVIPTEILKLMLKHTDPSIDFFFADPEHAVEAAYEAYDKYEKAQGDKGMLPMQDRIPQGKTLELSKAKQLQFTSDLELEASGADSASDAELWIPEKRMKKSLLLPNATAKRVEWNSAKGSPAKENEPAPHVNALPSAAAVQLQAVTATKRSRRLFSAQEVEYLKDGLRIYGRKWKCILAKYDFQNRTAADLKDKARTMDKSSAAALPAK